MTCFALAGKLGGFGASGLTSEDAASSPSCSNSAHRATIPKPPPARARNSRRDPYGGAMCGNPRGSSFDINELVQVEQHEAEIRQGFALVFPLVWRVEQGERLGALRGG